MTNIIARLLTDLASQKNLTLIIAPIRQNQETFTRHIALEHKQLVPLLKTIKNTCRAESISFLFSNQSHSQKTLSIVSPNTDDIATFHLALLSHRQFTKLDNSNPILQSKKNALTFFNSMRNSRLLTNNFTCLIGPDGVGKSTVASAILQATPSKLIRYKSVFRRSHTYKALYFSQKKKHSDKNNYDDLHPNSILITSLFRLYCKSLLSFFSRKIILSDRYTNDHLASHLRAVTAPQKSSLLFLKSKFIPAPRRIIQLDAPADVILSRRDELSEQTINFLSDFYLESSVLIKPKKIIYLNTNIPFDSTQKLALKLMSL